MYRKRNMFRFVSMDCGKNAFHFCSIFSLSVNKILLQFWEFWKIWKSWLLHCTILFRMRGIKMSTAMDKATGQNLLKKPKNKNPGSLWILEKHVLIWSLCVFSCPLDNVFFSVGNRLSRFKSKLLFWKHFASFGQNRSKLPSKQQHKSIANHTLH